MVILLWHYLTVGTYYHIPALTHMFSFYDLKPILFLPVLSPLSTPHTPHPTQVKRVKGLVVASRAEKASMNASLSAAKREAEGLQVALNEYKGEMEVNAAEMEATLAEQAGSLKEKEAEAERAFALQKGAAEEKEGTYESEIAALRAKVKKNASLSKQLEQAQGALVAATAAHADESAEAKAEAEAKMASSIAIAEEAHGAKLVSLEEEHAAVARKFEATREVAGAEAKQVCILRLSAYSCLMTQLSVVVVHYLF